jgi:tetratricopeptide (TPR) repeat protein
MKNRHVFCIFLCCLFALPLFGQSSSADSAAHYIRKGDALKDDWDHEGATIAYMTAIKFDPESYEANWKAGDQYTEIADRLPDDQKRQKEVYFTKARELCEKAIVINPDGWEAHLRLSVAIGRLALFRGGKEKIRLSEMVKAEAQKAIDLNPEDDAAYHVLARWHQNVANLSGLLKFFAKVLYGGVPPASNQESVEYFKKAIQIKPTHIEHHLELGRTYKLMGKKELARQSLNQALDLPLADEDDPKFKEEATILLKKLK